MKKQNPAKNNEEDNLPGYPHYPPEEDILKSAEEVPIDIENIARNMNVNTTVSAAGKPGSVIRENESLDETVSSDGLDMKLEADVTDEDISALGEIGLNIDGGDDDLLRNRPYNAIAGDTELDIPGAELDDLNELSGSEDEENNYYSLGSDDNDALENDSFTSED
jgi:hypothetical protein